MYHLRFFFSHWLHRINLKPTQLLQHRYAKNEKIDDKGQAIQPSDDGKKNAVVSRELAMRRAVQAQLKWDTNRARCIFCVGSDAMLRKKRLFVRRVWAREFHNHFTYVSMTWLIYIRGLHNHIEKSTLEAQTQSWRNLKQINARTQVHISENATLQLDANPLVPGHCRISPRDHVNSMTQADENQFEEVRLIENCLRRMITNAGMGCIMMETVRELFLLCI